MADLIPSGIDSTSGQQKSLTSGDTLVNASGASYGNAFPSGYIEGFDWLNSSGGNTVTVDPGSCRDTNDTYNMFLTAQTTVNCTTAHNPSNGLATLNGMDEKGLDNLTTGAITGSQSGTTITATASILPHLGGGITLTGTITSTGTAVTGTSTKFRTEVSIGDIIGSTTTIGFARIASIESDTALTLSAAFPGGDASGAAFDIYYSPTININDTSFGGRSIITINTAGTSITTNLSLTVSAGAPLTIGVPHEAAGIYSGTNASSQVYWFHIWLVDNGTTPGLLISTQRHQPLAPPSGYNRWRRLGAVGYQTDGPGIYRTIKQGNKVYIAQDGSSSPITSGVDVNLLPLMPQTSQLAILEYDLSATTGTDVTIRVLTRDDLVGTIFQNHAVAGNSRAANTFVTHTDPSQYIQVTLSASGSLTIYPQGFYDDLSYGITRVPR